MPDSFSKTVPIWCAVINRALKLRNLEHSRAACTQEWDTQLHTAPQSVSKSEHSQIEEKLDAWAKALAVSCFSLSKPLFFISYIYVCPGIVLRAAFSNETCSSDMDHTRNDVVSGTWTSTSVLSRYMRVCVEARSGRVRPSTRRLLIRARIRR